MRKSSIFIIVLAVMLASSSAAFSRQTCQFNILGTWKSVTAGPTDGVLYQFASDGTVTVLQPARAAAATEPQVLGRANYQLDHTTAPKSIALNTSEKNRVFLYGASSIEIVEYDDDSMTCIIPGVGKTRWVKVDPHHYFIAFIARAGEFYDLSGSAFPLVVKSLDGKSQLDAVGTYAVEGKRHFGPVPASVYGNMLNEPRSDSEVMLRLEINPAQYERALSIMQSWERRVRDGHLLYPERSYLNNVLLVKAVSETLNQCSEDIKMYNLNYLHPEDWITEKYEPGFVPFNYFKELRRLNNSMHVPDEEFKRISLPNGIAAAK
jgi:hypothetical protein